jgi:hypothetical protein
MAITFTVNSNTFEVLVFDTETNPEVPFLAQPDFPDASPFTSVKQASAWAQAFIEHRVDSTKPLPANAEQLN